MRFTKMHGAGNDYVFVDCFAQAAPSDPSALARAISDRHTGAGADGLILIAPSQLADARMRIFNADGSEAEMCGNGIRCAAKYLYDRGLVGRHELRIETLRGVLSVGIGIAGGRVTHARVNLGRPIFDPEQIPTALTGRPPTEAEIRIPAGNYRVTCLSMGNPHCVVFVEELTDALVSGAGPQLERHAAFPRRTNVEFARVDSRQQMTLRVWERGSGETLACGTGACAAAVAAVLTGRTDRSVLARLPGGDLDIHWTAQGDVFLAGPAVEVYTGQWPEEESPDPSINRA